MIFVPCQGLWGFSPIGGLLSGRPLLFLTPSPLHTLRLSVSHYHSAQIWDQGQLKVVGHFSEVGSQLVL